MALLEDQIEEAQAAFVAAHEANDAEGAQVLADHLRGLQAQKAEVDKAVQESSQAGTDIRNPMIAGGVGALVGATVNPLRGAVHNIITPPAAPPKMSAPAPSSLSTQLGQGGENWTKSLTGVDIPNAQMNKGSLDTAQRMAGTVGRGGEFAGGRITEGGIMLPPEIGAKPAAPAPVAPRTIGTQTKQAGKSLLQGIAGEPQPMSPFSIVKGGTRGAITGGVLADVPQQLAQGNYGTAASDVGIAAGNIAHGLAKSPKGRAIGSLLGLGSGIARGYQGIKELTGEPEVQKATGGLVHLAEGGQPEFGEARAYEPSYSEKIRDYAAQHIGREHANRLFGGANARPEDNFNPIAMAAQTPGIIADAATGFVKAGKEGDYLGGMGNYLMGAMNVAPMIKPAGQVAKTAMRELGPKAAGMAEDYLAKIGGISHIVPPSNRALSSTTIGAGFDPRYDPRKLEQSKLQNLTTKRERYQGANAPEMSIVDMEGSPFVTQMADRSGAGHYLQGINDVNFNRDVDLMGGQDFMLNNPFVWTSTPGASKQTMKHAQMLKEMTGKDPLLIPWRMGPQGSDFAHMTGETQLAYAQSAMGKPEKQLLDQSMKNLIPEWKGIDNPESMLQFKMLPSKTRKAVQFMIDKDFRNKGGLGIGEARLAIADPAQTDAVWGGMQNVGKIFADKPMIKHTGHWSYPGGGIPGEAVGTLNAADQQRNIYEMLPKAARERGIADPTKPSPDDLRALQMKPYTGIVTDKLLKTMGYAPGGKVMSATGKLLGDAQAAYKSKFTPGFVHSSPSNKITAFDPTKASKPKELITPGITFASPMENAKWSSDNFLPVSGPRSAIEGYKTGATMYPLSINMGKHFDATTPEGQEVAANYVRQKFLSGETPDKKEAAKFLMGISDPQYNWKTMESPDFIRHLKDTGHDTFSVNEMGVKNVGVFEPQNIRGKFAKFNPEDAASPDFMKAKGGLV
jgi:hypothetical protein